MDHDTENNDEEHRKLFCGNLDEQVDEELLFELFVQAGPLEKVQMPRDRDGRVHGYAFIVFKHPCSVPFAVELFEDTALFGKTPKLRARRAANHQRTQSAPVNFGQNSRGYDRYPNPQMDFDSLLQMSKTLLKPGLLGPPLLNPGLLGPPPTMGMPHQFLGPPVRMGSPMVMRVDRSQPLPPGEESFDEQVNEEDRNDGNISTNSLSHSSLQGNWSARNTLHMMPGQDRRSGYSRRGRDHHDREGERFDQRAGRHDHGGGRYDDRYNEQHDQSKYGRNRHDPRDHRDHRRGHNRSRSNDYRDGRSRY